jgi:hypothetical protein
MPCYNLVPCRTGGTAGDEEVLGTKTPDCKSYADFRRDEGSRSYSIAKDPLIKPSVSEGATCWPMVVSRAPVLPEGESSSKRAATCCPVRCSRVVGVASSRRAATRHPGEGTHAVGEAASGRAATRRPGKCSYTLGSDSPCESTSKLVANLCRGSASCPTPKLENISAPCSPEGPPERNPALF